MCFDLYLKICVTFIWRKPRDSRLTPCVRERDLKFSVYISGVEYQLGHRPVFFSSCRYYSVRVKNFNKVKAKLKCQNGG